MYQVSLSMPIEEADADNPLEAVAAFNHYVNGGNTYAYTVRDENTDTIYDVDTDGDKVEVRPKVWTVIAIYDDNEQPWAGSFEADTYEEAEALARADRAEEELSITIAGVIPGNHLVFGGDNEHGIY
jgi:hypothetical protein